MIKAAFFDIDGTLLSFKTHRVSEGTVRAFERLHRAGVRTFLSTGRPDVLIPDMPVSFEGKITMNGGLVFVNEELGMRNEELADAPDNSSFNLPHSTLLSNPIAQEDTEAWLGYAEKHGYCTMVFTRDGMMMAQPNQAGMMLRDQLEFTMPPVVSISEMRGLTAYQIIALMPEECDKEVQGLLPGCRLPRWHPAFTDIVATGNSKAMGMEAVCRHFGIKQEETFAIGDGANDVEMLQWAGIGVAMGNAADEVKRHADMVTTDVDHEGIEHAVDEVLGVK